MKTMKKTIFAILIVALAFVSCDGKKDVNYALISGKITNPNGGVIITKDKELVKEISVAEDGTFKDTIFNADGYYTFGHSREITPMYLEGGYDVTLILDTKQFDETVVYKGIGGKENNFLAHKFLIIEKEIGDARKFFALEEDAFLEKLNSVNKELEKGLKGLESSFSKKEQKALKYEYALKLKNYENYHKYVTKNNDFKVSNKFPNPLEGIDLTSEEDFKEYAPYKQLVLGGFYDKVKKEVGDNRDKFQEVFIEKIKKLKDGNIREALIVSLAGSVRDASEDSKKAYSAVMELSKDDELKKSLKAKMERFGKLAKGNPSPIFENYENYKGGTTSLKDFKGKFVYVDVWATWCGPCKQQIPFMKKIEEKYHKNRKIAFVSISIDDLKKKEAWKKMVKEKEMAGVQLFANNSWDSEFVKSYGINGIPRFLLIDPLGNIVDADAPRPSDPRLIELFKEQGIK